MNNLAKQTLTALVLVLACFCSPAGASGGWFGGGPTGTGKCPEGSVGVTTELFASDPDRWLCNMDANSQIIGNIYFGPGIEFGANVGTSGNIFAFQKSYVPYKSAWKLKTYFCSAMGPGQCSVGKQIGSLLSIYTVTDFSPQLPIGSHPGSFGGTGKIKFNTGVTLCYVLVDTASGVEWRSNSVMSCPDATNILPETPRFCYLNSQQELDVNLGTLNRDDITTTPGTTPGITKVVPVICSGDKPVKAKFQMFFDSSMDIGGKSVIQSSSPGLGVAVTLLGIPMGSGSSITLDFVPGVSGNGLVLNFEAVRNPKKPLSDIATGPVTAWAVLVMTQQ